MTIKLFYPYIKKKECRPFPKKDTASPLFRKGLTKYPILRFYSNTPR